VWFALDNSRRSVTNESMIHIDWDREANFSHAECVRDRHLFEYRKEDRIPSEIDNVIRMRYMHVLNGDGSVSMNYLLTIAENSN